VVGFAREVVVEEVVNEWLDSHDRLFEEEMNMDDAATRVEVALRKSGSSNLLLLP